jgi:exopolysaccharide biosynthesis polyprenyl glycosylphosphotransferase
VSQAEHTDLPRTEPEAVTLPRPLAPAYLDTGHEPVERSMDEVKLVAPSGRKSRLREALVGIDAAAFLGAWLLALFIPGRAHRDALQTLLVAMGTTLLGLWLLSVQELYLARVSAIRSVELSKLTRAALMAAGSAVLLTRIFHVPARLIEAMVGFALSLVFLITGRSVFRAYLSQARLNGRYCRRVLIVGVSAEAADIVELIATHPEAGFRVTGVVGERSAALANGLAAQWLGPVDDTFDLLHAQGTGGVILVAGAIPSQQLSGLVRGLQERNVHIQLSSGVRGIDFRRLRANPIAYEPLFYLEAPVLARRQIALKRLIDVVFGVLGLILASPLFVLIWLLVKLEDRGPVFFKQVRIGRHGRPFTVYKFRTMVVDAEARLKELQEDNERRGPLFKMTRDPRITRVGKFLRDSSLDELPQLINVVRGEMSMVGPRPALPSEVAQFDPELRDRLKVKPGVTGLWQVEARDNPSFDAYRRLDLYYVENWSVSLDLIILLATVEQVIARLVSSVFSRQGNAEGASVPMS